MAFIEQGVLVLESTAILLKEPGKLALDRVPIRQPDSGDLVIRVDYSGVSTGTEKLFWEGSMPPFPGMGFPLVPGYEACGEVLEADSGTGFKSGDFVFVPGANCFDGAYGLFGASARTLVSASNRVTKLDAGLGPRAALLALAATARHAMASGGTHLPDLIVGHGVLGRLLARLTILAGGKPPTVWEIDPLRQSGADGYRVCHPDEDEEGKYDAIYDASGNASLIDRLISKLNKKGELVLAGFYTDRPSFSFAPAFMREARLRVAAEWNPQDLDAIRRLIDSGEDILKDLITHERMVAEAPQAYPTAFGDSSCLKMIFNWEGQA